MSNSDEEHWLEQLKTKVPDRKEYGFAFYYHPTLLRETQLGKIRARHDNHIDIDTPATLPFILWDYQLMKWPEQLRGDEDPLSRHVAELELGGNADADDEEDDSPVDDFDEDPIINFDRGSHPRWWRTIASGTLDPASTSALQMHNRAPLDDRDADFELRRVFEGLRADFRRFRSLPRVPAASRDGFGYWPGLLDSMHDRCFVVFDPYSAFTWFDEFHSDLAWAWMVDADFEDADPEATTNGVTEQYRGYLRVMLKELTGNFAEAVFLQPADTNLQILRLVYDDDDDEVFLLEKRGCTNEYTAKDIQKILDNFIFLTPTYPSGSDSDTLDSYLPEGSRKKRYFIANPGECGNASINNSGTTPDNWAQIDADHPIDRPIFPNSFLQFVRNGTIVARDKGPVDTFTTQQPTWKFAQLRNYFAQDYNTWNERANLPQVIPGGSASSAVSNALGSYNNPNSRVNLEAGLNSFKGNAYTRRADLYATRRFNQARNNPTQANAEYVLSRVRSGIAESNYLNSIYTERRDTPENIRRQLQTFDTLYVQATGRPEQLTTLHIEFWRE